MNYEHRKKIVVKNIFASGDDDLYEFAATVNNYSMLCKSITIGENLASNVFDLIFPQSIGESQWRLLLYPRGQYFGEKVGKSVGIYLQMVSCEHADKILNAMVSFQLMKKDDGAGPVKNVEIDFDYTVPLKRWIGEPNFVGQNWLKKKQKQFFTNDSLTIRCMIKETEAIKHLVNDPEGTQEPSTEPINLQSQASSTEASNLQHPSNGRKRSQRNGSQTNLQQWITVSPKKGAKEKQIKKQNPVGASKSNS